MDSNAAVFRRGQISNLQVLRALAASAVVFLHTTDRAGLGWSLTAGNFGVDIFFTISGFIIPYIAASNPSHFLAKRLIRIVPLYWCATLVLFGLATLRTRYLHHTAANPGELALSLFFIPFARQDGSITPLLISGWTLNYEMYFYLLFFVAILLSKRWAHFVAAAMVLCTFVLAQALGPNSVAARFYGNPIILEFVLGMAIFEMFHSRDWSVSGTARKPTIATCIGIIVSLLTLAALADMLGYSPRRLIYFGIPAAAIVFFSLYLELGCGAALRSRLLIIAGDSSYATYLIHPYIIYAILRVVVPERQNLAAQCGLVVSLVIICNLVAWSVYAFGEKPFLRWANARIADKSSKAASREYADSNLRAIVANPPV